MIVVSDTSPLNYLVLIDAIDALPTLFGRVITPPGVMAELQHPRTPSKVLDWAAHPPSWLEIRAPARIDPTLTLDLGESEAISLAVELTAHQLLIDDQKARAEAQARGLAITGTLAVIIEAGRQGILNLSQTAARLQQTNFRASADIWARLISKP